MSTKDMQALIDANQRYISARESRRTAQRKQLVVSGVQASPSELRKYAKKRGYQDVVIV
jgi:hypothetical protein